MTILVAVEGYYPVLLNEESYTLKREHFIHLSTKQESFASCYAYARRNKETRKTIPEKW